MAEGNMNSELLMMMIGQDILSDITKSEDHIDALRKALLFMIFLSEESEKPSIRMFTERLLGIFPALSYGLKKGKYPMTGSHSFSVVRDENNRNLVTVNRVVVDEYQNKILLAKGLEDLLPAKYLRAIVDYYKEPLFEWEIIAKRHIGFFDIMGFKNVVERFENNYEEFHLILSRIVEAVKRAEFMHVKKHQTEKHSFEMSHEDEAPGQLRFIQFSDSIMVFTHDDSSESAMALEMAAQIIFLNALFEGLLLRGALATGEIVADFEKNIFFGQAIIDAYLLEEKQQWYGVAYHETFAALRSEVVDTDDIRSATPGDIPISIRRFLLKAKTPRKELCGRICRF